VSQSGKDDTSKVNQNDPYVQSLIWEELRGLFVANREVILERVAMKLKKQAEAKKTDT